MGLTNEEMDRLISEVKRILGKSEIISETILIEEAEGEETTYLEVTEEGSLRQGELRALFRIEGNEEIILDKPKILLSTGKFSRIESLILSVRKKLPKRKPLLAVFAEPGDSHIAVQEKTDETYVFQTLSPDGTILEDIATLVGGKILQEGQPAIGDLGQAGRVVIYKDEFHIVGGKGSVKNINARVHQIKAEMNKARSPLEETLLLNRLTMLSVVATIKVGGKTKGEKEAGVNEFKRRLAEWGTGGRWAGSYQAYGGAGWSETGLLQHRCR